MRHQRSNRFVLGNRLGILKYILTAMNYFYDIPEKYLQFKKKQKQVMKTLINFKENFYANFAQTGRFWYTNTEF